MKTAALAKTQEMRRALAIAKTPQECATLAQKAKAVALWAKHIGLSLVELNRIARFRIECMRKAGAMLALTVRRGGDRKSNRQRAGLIPDGVGEDDSRRWQSLARIAEKVLDTYCAQCAKDKMELTQSGFVEFFKSQGKSEKKAAVAAAAPHPDIAEAKLENVVAAATRDESPVRYGCIYADPPWKYGNQGTRASTDTHYVTMSVDEICALPIAKIAADDAHLHLWTTNAFLFDAKRVMEAWGFEYKSCFVWVKPQMGIGNYWRVSHEFLLLGIRGDAPFLAHDVMSWAELERTKHSTKPDKIRQLIERVSPGPRIELFGRNRFDGWSVWGNQVQERSDLFARRAAK